MTPARHILQDQLLRLNRVIAGSDQPWRVEEAKRHAAKIESILANNTDWALEASRGLFGPNGHGAAIDEICRHMDVVAKVHAFTPPIGFSREDGSGLIFIPGEAA
jgi:hypothetical protein